MNADELRDLQAPLKALYKREPEAARITLRARGHVETSSLRCRLETGKPGVAAGLHSATGGDGSLACSGDMLLEALVSCAGVTLAAVATALSIELESAAVVAEGEVDFRGTLGVSKDAPVGFRELRIRLELKSSAPPDKLRKLVELTERYCVVFQTLAQPPRLEVQIDGAG